MAAEEDTDTLKLYWDHFFKAETGTYEKSTWLDLFLAEFLIRVNDGADPKQLIKFCPVSGVVTLVGCELLCGIHRVMSSMNTHCAAPLPLPCLDAPCSGKLQPPVGADADADTDADADADADHSASTEARGDETKLQSSSLFTRTFNAQSSEQILRKYLLGGAAWRCLVLLKALGVEGLSCCRQLSTVLILLFGELSAAPAAGGGAALPPPAPRTPIHQLFSHRIWSKQKPTGSQTTTVNSAASSDKGSATGRSRHPTQMKFDSLEKTKRKSNKQSEQSSESGGSDGDLLVLNRSLAVRASTPSDHFHYFNNTRSSNEYPNDSYFDPFYPPRKTKPKADDYMNEKHKEIINSEITTFQFTLIITDLLQELCKAESSLSGSEGSQISMQCINFSLRNLCSLQFSSQPHSQQNNTREASRIKVALTELLIVSLDQVLIHSDLCAKLINNGILPMLLRILEDVISKSKQNKLESHNHTEDDTESENLLKFVFGIAYSVIAFFHCLLMQCRTVDKLKEFTDQFKLYGECLKGGLLKECIELMIRIPAENEDAVVLIKKLIEIIGKLISGMKRVRSEVIHSAACPRARHAACRARVAAGMHHHHAALGGAGMHHHPAALGGAGMHHHHAALGGAGMHHHPAALGGAGMHHHHAALGGAAPPACCLALLHATLADLLTDDRVTAHSVLRNKILKVMLNCGVCCCFSPGFLMECVVRLMLTHNCVASLCLQVLERTVYGDLGASVLLPKVTDQLPCSICEPSDERKDAGRKFCSHGVSPIERKSVWSFLYHYNSLLQLDNHNNVLHATVSHLLRVTPKCRMEMKYELLFSVIYPTFIVAKHRYIIRMEESAYFLTVSCLNIFASLLNTVPFAEQFIQKGGLSYVLELVSLPEFSNQCCSILEIAIIVEIFKLMKENSEMSYYREMNSLASVRMLFKSLGEMTDKCYKIYKQKLPAEKFEELCDVTKERNNLAFIPPADRVQPRKISPVPASSENIAADSIEDSVEDLKNIWTFWKTCAGLCLYSPMFREFVGGAGVFLDSYALLKLLLHFVCQCECAPPERRVLIKIIEALLTVQLAVSDVTSGRSKETTCGLVRGALAAPAARGAGGSLRAMCEALIRVATARPSRHHAMPRLNHAKVPPLLCPSGGSSADCSSSEDSVAAPYASEHSEPYDTRPDEGYEADVEIGKLDLPPLYKTRKLSASLSNIMSGLQSPAGEPAPAGAECGEYAAGQDLAHPELCVIVVDILTQLIQKLLSSKECEGGVEAGAGRAGVAMARACCARLGAALARARRAPPLLLQRLLAPAAAQLLTTTGEHLEELQRSILDLIHVVASQSIEPAELASFLRLFTHERPPLGLLLGALQRLVTAAAAAPAHNTPDCILTFPVDSDYHDGIQSLSEELGYLVVNSATSQSQQAENCAKRFHEGHNRAGVVSPWSVHAVRCGVEGAGWAPWLAGFALSAWLLPQQHAPHAHQAPHAQHAPHAPHAQRWDGLDDLQDEASEAEVTEKKSPPRKEPAAAAELSHVLSLGHDSLMFEVWLDTTTGTFILRLSRPEVSSNRVVSETRVASPLPPRQWACLALNVRERVYKRHIYIQVTMYINGYECETVSLPVQGILIRKVTPTNVLIGHACGAGGGGGGGAVGGGAGVFHLGNVHVYRAPALSAYTAMHLAAHGPDHACQVRCEMPNYPLLLTPHMLDSNIDWDQVFEISSATLRELHDNLLLTFAAHAPNIMNLYHQTVALPTVFAGRVASTGSLMAAAAGAAGAGAGAAGAIPEALYTVWAGGALPSRHRGFSPALYMLGGPEVLLYLYARVVELEGSAAEQALALGVVLRACRADARLHAALYAGDALDMLLAVLAAPACHVSHHLLQVILEEACSASVVSVASAAGGGVQLSARSDAAVLQPALLLLLARAWRHLDTDQELIWEVDSGGGSRESQRGSAWALALCCLQTLLRDEHPRRAFNHYQMNRVGLLDQLLLACKERFLNSERGPLGAAGSAALVAAVRGLLHAPPPPHRLALLADFLLLMHQASDTFVTHSRANFYFVLASETQEMSEYSASFSKRRPSKRSKRGSDSTRPSVSSTDDIANDNSLNAHKETPSREVDDRIDSSGSTESTKLMKGIINMKIKEGRKHNTSSTSENSDTVVEPSEEGAPPADGARVEGVEEPLTDYIVVDEDDVNHTTVEMYTSGIYHQRRVRAGAAPGWSACEGLLLLLRDALAVLPDHLLHQTLSGAVQAECLVVLANHRSARVRAALVRVLAALARRAPPDLARKLHHQHYYIHLANQISLYEGSWELAAACAALLTKCDVPLEDQLDDDIWVDVSEEALQRCPPLLALLPACLRDAPLAHNVTLLARRIIDKASLKVLNEVSLVEVVVRSIRAAGDLGGAGGEGRELLLEDLYELLNRVAVKALATQHSMQTISELHHLLTYVELEAGGGGGAGAGGDGEACVLAARGAQRALFNAQLDYLEERLHEHARAAAAAAAHTKQHNYFAVLSSAVSLGGEGWARAERAERGELAARHAAAAARAAHFLLTHDPRQPLGPDTQLYDRLLDTLIHAVSGGSGTSGAPRPKWWVSGSAEWAAPLQELFWWAAAPAPGARRLQPRLLRALYHAPPHALHALTPTDPAAQRKLAVYLVSMLQWAHGAEAVELPITDWARAWAAATQAGLAERVDGGSLGAEAAALLHHDLERWARRAGRNRALLAKVVWSKAALAARVAEGAMQVTRGAVELQNAQRKAFLEHLRRAHAHQAAAPTHWQRLVDDYTHDQALWHMPQLYPQSWRLDERESAGRVRVRLRRAHLHLQPRFLKPQHRHKAEMARRGSPLGGVVGARARGAGGGGGGLAARLQPHETVHYMARVTCVTVAAELDGELLLSDRCIHFVPEEPAPVEAEGEGERSARARRKERLCIPEVAAAAAAQAHSWALGGVRHVAARRWCLQERAVELFLASGHAYLLAFADHAERAAFLKALAACHQLHHHPDRSEPDTLAEAMAQWRSGAITNWEYLMRLNALAGRSYNDLMQYPVLPFVIADYSSRILDLHDPASFRDLTRPMAVQNKAREHHYINVYNDLKAARREGCSPLARAPHHYASLYSNSGGVLHYLVRLPPFTELFLNYQDNNFDMPDRTFHSLATTWRLITNDSPTDVKELIPELFYLPELFHNNEGLELGVRQCGAAVDSVELPPWAADARLFTLAHRQALEAAHVTDHLPHWIDLVFGYKQTGQPALDAINVFPACTYYGFDPSAHENEVDRTAAEAMVRTYGQAPRQLLRQPHPHQAPDLAHHQHQEGVFAGVSGARWGRYCGSPALPPPGVVARRALPAARALLALPAPRAVAVAPAATALLPLHGESTSNNSQNNGLGPLALVSWGHSDNIVRVKRRRDARPEPLLHVPALDQITVVTSTCAGGRAGCPYPLVLGFASGRVLALRVRAEPPRLRTRALHAHARPLTDMHACAGAGLLVTASADGNIVLWDLHKLTYIRTLPNRDMLAVTRVTVSETLCDVASVYDLAAGRAAAHDTSAAPDAAPAAAAAAACDADSEAYEKDAAYKYKSLIRVHTVNARFVGSVKVSERVTCICYSNAPEGVSVNSVACGLETGGVRLYSSWDLRALRQLPPPDSRAALISLTYSSESSVLFGCYSDGIVLAWESGAHARPSPPRILPAHALA